MDNRLVFLDSYVLQQDMRIRLPKSILSNLNIKKGETVFDIFIDSDENIVLKIKKETNNE